MIKQDAPSICRATDIGDASAVCLRDEPPERDAITDYDEAHMALYLRLLYGHAEGHSVSRLASDVFDTHAGLEPERAQKIVGSHLRRAKWLCEEGKRHLLTPAVPD